MPRRGAARPGGDGRGAGSRRRVVGASFSDRDALLTGTGRRAPTLAERAELGDLAKRLPLVLG
ncbi:hypothetical protein [Nonomuraea candida]|uniref:hypothetical protein n=1 Tax=Nonomuraea candida TaxID=359159 RepID=UPI0005B8B451|nr:hypothetical protein [Nonomuraea candida]